MTFDLIYCPRCGHCYPRYEDAHTLPCGHSMAGTVKMWRETVGPYEVVAMKVSSRVRVEATLLPDGNGRRLVEYKKKGYKNKSLASLPAYLAHLERRAPALVAAFQARRDVRRGA